MSNNKNNNSDDNDDDDNDGPRNCTIYDLENLRDDVDADEDDNDNDDDHDINNERNPTSHHSHGGSRCCCGGGLIRQLSSRHICPIDHRMGSSYVHSIANNNDGIDHVGTATHMLSYSWSYTIGDIVDSLMDYCITYSLDPRRTYIWICCLCINQHRVVEQMKLVKQQQQQHQEDDEQHLHHQQQQQHQINFYSEFSSRVKDIGHVLAMMSPWHSPGYVKRVWCIFELYVATTALQTTRNSSERSDNDGLDEGNNNDVRSSQVTIIMPPREKLALQNELLLDKTNSVNDNAVNGDNTNNHADHDEPTGKPTGIDALYDVLGKTRVQDAQASVETDRTRILNMVQQHPGFGVLNQSVNDFLREWVKTTLYDAIQSRQDNKDNASNNPMDMAKFYHRVCTIFSKNGEYDMALEMIQKAIMIYEEQKQVNQQKYQSTVRDKDGVGEKTFAAASSTITLDHARCFHTLGQVLLRKGQNKDAIENLQKALDVLESQGDPLELCNTYDAIGSVHQKMGKYDEALAYLHRSLDIRSNILGADNVSTAKSYSKIGHCLYYKRDYEGALREYQRELDVFEKVYGPNHPNTAGAINNTAAAWKHLGNLDMALSQHRKALAIVESVLGKDHPEAGRIINNIGSVLFHMKEYDKSLIEYQRALTIRQSAFGDDHPYTSASYYNVALVLEMSSSSAADLREAMVLLERAHSSQLKLLGTDHPNTVRTHEKIESIQEQLKQV